MLFTKTLRKSRPMVSYPFTARMEVNNSLQNPLNLYVCNHQKIKHVINVNTVKEFHSCAVFFARKPRWLPVAPSKMFKITEKPLLPKDESDEIEYHQIRYETVINSLVSFQQGKDREAITKYNIKVGSAEDEISHLIVKNEIINAEISQRRKKLQELEWSIVENEILSLKAIRERNEQERYEQQEKFVINEVKRLKTAIKMEDLDEAILKAMGSVTDYNFSIDGKGNFYPGRHNIDKAHSNESSNTNQFSIQCAI